MYKIVFLFLVIGIYSCNLKHEGNTEIKPHIDKIDKWIDSVETRRIEHEKTQLIILEYKDSNEVKSFFEMVDSNKIKEFRNFLANNYIRKYSFGLVMVNNSYSLHFGIGNMSSIYFVNTNWKKDSVVIVEYGYQGYTPMSKKDWTAFINDFKKVKQKIYRTTDLKKGRKAYRFIKENNISAQFQVDEKKSDIQRNKNLQWLKYEGYFEFNDTIRYEDKHGNNTKMKLMAIYPHEKFDISLYAPYADLNESIYYNKVTVYSDSSFCNKFDYNKVMKEWKRMELLITVFSDDKKISQLDSILLTQ